MPRHRVPPGTPCLGMVYRGGTLLRGVTCSADTGMQAFWVHEGPLVLKSGRTGPKKDFLKKFFHSGMFIAFFL